MMSRFNEKGIDLANKPKKSKKTGGKELVISKPTLGILSVFPPVIAILIFLVSVSFWTSTQTPTLDIKWFLLKISVPILIVMWLLICLIRKKWDWVSHPIHFPLLIYIVVVYIAQFHPSNRFYLLDILTGFMSLTMIYILVAQSIRSVKAVIILFHGLLISGLVTSVYAILQKLNLDPVNWEKGFNIGNISSTMGNSNLFGWYLAMLIPISLGYMVLGHANIRGKIISVLYFVLPVIALVIARNRAGVVAILTSLLLLGWMILTPSTQLSVRLFTDAYQSRIQWINRKKVWIQTGIVLILIIGLTGFWQYYSSRSDIAIKGRFLHWQISARMIQDHPVLGLGPGNYFLKYLDYQKVIFADPRNSGYHRTSKEMQSINAAYAHNEFIQQITDTGFLGFAVLLLFILTYLFTGYRELKFIRDKNILVLYLSCYVGVIAGLITAMFGFPWHVPVTGSQFWVLIGLTVALSRMDLTKPEPGYLWQDIVPVEQIFKLDRKPVFIAIVLIASTGYGLWSIPRSLVDFRSSYYIRQARVWAEKEGNFQQAAGIMEYVIQLSPTSGLAHYYLGGYYANLNRYDDAIAEYGKAMKNYMDIHINYNLGQIYYNKKDYPIAEEYYKNALALDENEYRCHLQLGLIYTYRNEFQKALDEVNRYLEFQLSEQEREKALKLADALKKEISKS